MESPHFLQVITKSFTLTIFKSLMIFLGVTPLFMLRQSSGHIISQAEHPTHLRDQKVSSSDESIGICWIAFARQILEQASQSVQSSLLISISKKRDPFSSNLFFTFGAIFDSVEFRRLLLERLSNSGFFDEILFCESRAVLRRLRALSILSASTKFGIGYYVLVSFKILLSKIDALLVKVKVSFRLHNSFGQNNNVLILKEDDIRYCKKPNTAIHGIFITPTSFGRKPSFLVISSIPC